MVLITPQNAVMLYIISKLTGIFGNQNLLVSNKFLLVWANSVQKYTKVRKVLFDNLLSRKTVKKLLPTTFTDAVCKIILSNNAHIIAHLLKHS